MTSVSEAAAIGSIVGLATAQLGTHEHNQRVKYCDWWYSTGLSPHVRSLLWCDVFVSWVFHERGMSAAIGGRYAFTVAHRQWFQKHARKVSFRDARPGDVIFYRFPTSGSRNGNPVNHVEIVTRGYSGGYIKTIGGNTPKPGTYGDPSDGRGVWEHTRSTYAVVDLWRPVWSTVVASNPGGKVICKGDQGGEVKALQRYLNSRSGVKPKLKVDGIFKGKTERALKQWQRNNGLVVDGRYGPKCRAKRRHLYRMGWRRRMLAVKGKLREGDQGHRVKVLQCYLNSRPHVHRTLEVDGVFGDDTAGALKKWQRNNHLDEDAIWGPKCHAKCKQLTK